MTDLEVVAVLERLADLVAYAERLAKGTVSVAKSETDAQRKARETQERAAEAQAAADSAKRSGHTSEAKTYEAIARWIDET